MADGVEVLGERLAKPVATIRLGPLLVTGALGLALVVAHIVVELQGDSPALSGLMLEVGAGLLLFAVLLVVQNRLVERAISAARGLTPDELVSKQAEGEANPLTPGDFHADLGPLAVAGAVVRDLADGAFRDAWLHFIEIEARQYAEGVAGYNDDLYGWSQRRRIVGPMHEMVLAIRLPRDAPHGILVDRPTIVSDTIKVLVSAHVVSDRVFYLVAGINHKAAPLPTWPPTWWAIDDPVAAVAHPGMQEDL